MTTVGRRTSRAKAVRRAARHSQRGVVINESCPDCGGKVYSNQRNRFVMVGIKATFAHMECPRSR